MTNLAIDLNPSPVEPRVALNPKLRPVFLLSVIILVATFMLTGVNMVRMRVANKQTERASQEENQLREQIKDTTLAIAKANAARTKAEGMGRWLTTLLNTQPFVISVLSDIGEKAISVQSVNLILSEGQAQIDSVGIIFLGDAKLISQHIENMTSRLQTAGFQLVSPDSVPTNGGIRFRGRFIYPPANSINWNQNA